MAKKTTKKTGTKTAKKPAAKKPAAAKPPAKPAAKKSAKKPTAKAPAKKAPKKADAKKPAPKKTDAKKAPAKPAGKKAPEKKPADDKPKADSKPAAKDAPKNDKPDDGKPARKGITIVDKKKTIRRPQPKKYELPKPKGGGLAAMLGKPLIPSGPKAPAVQAEEESKKGRRRKSPFNKKQLDHYRDVLIQKRRELLGDIDAMEGEALLSNSGSLSSTPQHAAEQGSDAYDQSLSLDLAAADRVTIREIDAALARIADGSYGLCEETNEPIGAERLESIPWARLSIKAAEESDRRRYGR